MFRVKTSVVLELPLECLMSASQDQCSDVAGEECVYRHAVIRSHQTSATYPLSASARALSDGAAC